MAFHVNAITDVSSGKKYGSDNPAFGFKPSASGARSKAREAELLRLVAEQAADAEEDETGLRTTLAKEFLAHCE